MTLWREGKQLRIPLPARESESLMERQGQQGIQPIPGGMA